MPPRSLEARPADERRYSALQIALHWTVVALILVQWLTADGMGDFWDGVEDGERAPGLPPFGAALIHAASGAAVLLLMLLRLILRVTRGAPPLPSDLHPLLKLAAHLNHFAFYAVLAALPLTGAAAVLGGIEDAADLHEALKTALLLLAAMHVGAVAYHMLIRRDGLLWRMLRPG